MSAEFVLHSSPIALCRSSHVSGHSSLCQERLGGLTFRRGAVLTSTDPRFGGLSGLLYDRSSQQAIAVADHGLWVTFSPQAVLEAPAASNGTFAPLLNGSGVSVVDLHDANGARLSDAEAVARTARGSLLVSFERVQRIWEYGLGRWHAPLDMGGPGYSWFLSECDGSRGNHGVEALEMINATHALAICEGPAAGQPPGLAPAFVFRLGGVEPPARLWYELQDDIHPVDLARLPRPVNASGQPIDAAADPGFLLLERMYRPRYGNKIRLRRLTMVSLLLALAAPQAPGSRVLRAELLAELVPEQHRVDNFEGLAVSPPRARDAGQSSVDVFIVSDDNFNPTQRTLLYQLEMPLAPLPHTIEGSDLPIYTYLPALVLDHPGAAAATALASLAALVAIGCLCRRELSRRGGCRCCGGAAGQALVRPRRETLTEMADRAGARGRTNTVDIAKILERRRVAEAKFVTHEMTAVPPAAAGPADRGPVA